jgi:hypothetical protein
VPQYCWPSVESSPSLLIGSSLERRRKTREPRYQISTNPEFSSDWNLQDRHPECSNSSWFERRPIEEAARDKRSVTNNLEATLTNLWKTTRAEESKFGSDGENEQAWIINPRFCVHCRQTRSNLVACGLPGYSLRNNWVPAASGTREPYGFRGCSDRFVGSRPRGIQR